MVKLKLNWLLLNIKSQRIRYILSVYNIYFKAINLNVLIFILTYFLSTFKYLCSILLFSIFPLNKMNVHVLLYFFV